MDIRALKVFCGERGSLKSAEKAHSFIAISKRASGVGILALFGLQLGILSAGSTLLVTLEGTVLYRAENLSLCMTPHFLLVIISTEELRGISMGCGLEGTVSICSSVSIGLHRVDEIGLCCSTDVDKLGFSLAAETSFDTGNSLSERSKSVFNLERDCEILLTAEERSKQSRSSFSSLIRTVCSIRSSISLHREPISSPTKEFAQDGHFCSWSSEQVFCIFVGLIEQEDGLGRESE